MASASEINEITLELPTEIWEQIFSHLSAYQLCKVRSTCRRLKTIVDQEQSLMERLNFTLRCSKPSSLGSDYSPEIPDLPIRAANLSLVKIIDIDAWWPSLGSGLTTLRLFNCKLALARLVEMLRRTPNLVNLTLKTTEYTSLECAVPEFQLDRLEKLTVDEGSIFEALIPICTRLKRLCLESSYGLEDRNDSVSFELINNVRVTLEKLDFNLSEYGNQHLFERVEIPTETEPMFPNLKQLKIHFEEEIPDSDDIPLAKYLATMPRLEELDIFAPHVVEFDGLQATNLKKLSLQDIYPCNLNALSTGAPKLRELELEAGGIPSWGDVFDIVDKIPTLQSLEVSSPEPLSYEPCLANARPNNLACLSLYDCNRFDARLLNKFLKLSPQLKKLQLLKMDMNNETIKIIGNNLRQIEQLVLDIRGGIRPESAKFIVNNCIMLKNLNIHNHKQFYEEAKELVEHKRNVVVEFVEDSDSE